MIWKKIKWPSRKRFSKAQVLLVLIVFLITGTIRVSLPRSGCAAVRNAHNDITSTVRHLRPHDQTAELANHPFHTSTELLPLLSKLRRQSSRFLRLRDSNADCKIPPIMRRKYIEYSLSSRYHTDGVILYLIAVLGSTRNSFVEIDGAHGAAFFGAATVTAIAFNWSTHAIHETWTSYDAASRFYDKHPNVDVIDAGRLLGHEMKIGATHLFGGAVDIAAVFPRGGDEISFLKTFNHKVAWIRPRLLFLFFQDYWGSADRSRVSNSSYQRDGRSDRRDWSRNRLFVGASLPGVERVAHLAGYRLVWCLASAPIAFFVDARASVGHHLLPTLAVDECLKVRFNTMWRRDAERMWDDAQAFEWKTG